MVNSRLPEPNTIEDTETRNYVNQLLRVLRFNFQELENNSGTAGLTEEEVDDRVNALLQEGSGITLTYDDAANTLTISASAGGGNVSASGTGFADNQIVRFDGVTGQLIQASGVTLDDSANLSGILNITLTGTVDGRNIATDGSKLDGIESGAQVNTVDSVNGATGVVVLDSDDVSEGSTNLYNRVPTGGTTGQVLVKSTGTNYDAAWTDVNQNITNNFYVTLGSEQLFNPDSSAVSANTDVYTLSSSDEVAFVTVNGQVLSETEYNLVGANLTVTPDNGFNSTSDEVLVRQLTNSFDISTFVTRVTTSQTISTSSRQWNGNTDGGNITLTLPAGTQGQEFKLVNTGTSGNSLTVAPNGAENLLGSNSNVILNDGESLIIGYDTTDGWY